MLRAAIIFFVMGLLAVLFGAYNVAGISFEMGRLLLWAFLALAVVSVVVGLVTGRSSRTLP